MSRSARYRDQISLIAKVEKPITVVNHERNLGSSFVSFQITSPRHRFHMSEGQNSRAFLITTLTHFHRTVANSPFLTL
jgi:hypothetical protein